MHGLSLRRPGTTFFIVPQPEGHIIYQDIKFEIEGSEKAVSRELTDSLSMRD